MAGKSAWDLIQPGISSFIDSFKPENVPVSEGWKKSAQTQNELRKKFQDYAPGVTREKPGESSYIGPGGNPNGSGQGQAQQKPGMGPYQGHSVPTATASTPTVPTRDVQKASGAKGTQTSPGGGMPVLDAATAAAFLQSKGIGLGAFSSVQLPNAGNNPNSGFASDAVPFGGQETSVTKNTLGAFTSGIGTTIPNLDSTAAIDGFANPEAIQAIGSTYGQYGNLVTGSGAPTSAPKPTQKSGGGSSRLNEALADTAGMRSYMSKFGSAEDDKRRAADMAFLNAGTAQEGLRAKEAVLGQFHAGGQTYQLNDAGDSLLQGDNGKPAAMDSKASSAYRLGTIDAESYKNSYKDQVKDIQATITDPKQAENPTAQAPVPVSTNPAKTVDPNVIENYDFTKPGAEDAYFGAGGILEKATGGR